MKHSLLALALACSFVSQVVGQQPTTSQTPPASDQDEVVRITTNLVQIDAVVTDRNGKQITDLSSTDFAIYEDGHPQEIKNFSFISLQPMPTTAAPTPAPERATAAPVPPIQLRPERVRRTFGLVVDERGLSLGSLYFARKSRQKLGDERLQRDE